MINIKVAAVINPSPPIVIIANITTCPNIDQYSAVETAVWPVTVAADVAVSMAIRNGVKLLSEQFVIPALQLLEIGSSNNRSTSHITSTHHRGATFCDSRLSNYLFFM